MNATLPSQSTQISLSGNALKLIAIIAMTLAHVSWVLFPGFPLEAVPLILHIVGHLTAPIMMFFIVEGYYHTRNRKKYLTRLLILALITHIPFTLMFSSFTVIPGIPTTSVIWPFAMGLLALMIDKKDILPDIKNWQRIALTWACLIAALPSSWSMPAALTILFMGREYGNFKRQMMGLMGPLVVYALVYALLFDLVYGLSYTLVCMVIPLLAAYNGKRGTIGGKAMKWLFYIYYPGHLLILGILKTWLLSFGA